MSKVLIVEDELSIAELEKDYLELSSFEVEIETDGQQGLEKALKNDFDMIILDIMLPGVDGFEICKQIREAKEIPILMVSARKEDIDKIRGLGLGADDYITKPFNPPILLARIGVVLKRTTDKNAEKSRGNVLNMEYKGVILNAVGGCIEHEGKKIDLTKNELKILHLLYQKKGEIVPRLDMIEYLWDNEVFIDDNTLSVNVTRLRGKLADIGVTDFIETKRGMGYRI